MMMHGAARKWQLLTPSIVQCLCERVALCLVRQLLLRSTKDCMGAASMRCQRRGGALAIPSALHCVWLVAKGAVLLMSAMRGPEED